MTYLVAETLSPEPAGLRLRELLARPQILQQDLPALHAADLSGRGIRPPSLRVSGNGS